MLHPQQLLDQLGSLVHPLQQNPEHVVGKLEEGHRVVLPGQIVQLLLTSREKVHVLLVEVDLPGVKVREERLQASTGHLIVQRMSRQMPLL